MRLSEVCWLAVLAVSLMPDVIYGDTFVYMDSPVSCGRTYPAGDLDVFVVKPRGSVGVSNPPTSCITSFESSQSSSNYQFEIVIESAQFMDCSLELRVFNGPSAGGSYERMLGCGTSGSTGHIYPKDRSFTLQLTRTRDQYVYGNDFQLRVQLYYNQDGPDEITGTAQFPVAGIVGVVLGVIVFIAATILLAWCYKTGRLPGVDSYSYPTPSTKASTENLSKAEVGNGGFVSWHNTETKSIGSESRSNFDLSDSRVWESLTNVTVPRKDNIKSLNVPPPKVPNAASRGQGGNFDRADTKQLSNSPGTRLRGRGRDYYTNDKSRDQFGSVSDDDNTTRKEASRQGTAPLRGRSRETTIDDKTNPSGVFVNPDKEGYMYDYDQVKQLEGDKEKHKTQDFATELQAAIRKASIKRQQSENQTDSDGFRAQSSEGVNELSELDSNSAINKDNETSGPDAQSSPKPKKKRRKSSKERKSPKSSRRQKDGEGGSPKWSPTAKPRRSLNLGNKEDAENVPPEAYAPIFSGDEEPGTSMEYSHQYQPGYQGNAPAGVPFDPRYPMGPYQPGMTGMYPPGMPYQQAGQAQWFVEANPNGQHKMAFAMQTHSQSDDSLQGGRGPHYTSTPYTPANYNRNDDSALVPAGTILDDPHVPKPGTSLMRYDNDPISGVKTSQVIWTDARKDPTDPPPDSSTQITRKTITRITTRSTDDQLTEAPNPTLQDMSWRAAQQIQATGGQEPAFMSPTRAPVYNNAIQYATETPERSNASYYMGSHYLPQ